MSEASKFVFDKVFVPGEPHPDDIAASMVAPDDVPAYSQNQVDEMLLAARNEGVADAIASAKEDTGAFTAQTLEYITQEMTRLGTFQDSIVQAIHKEAVELAQIIALKLARRLMAREPKTEVSALISDMLRQFSALGTSPRLVVCIHPALLDSITEEIDKLTVSNAYNGEIVILEGEGFGPTDCSIEWAEGGARRDVVALELEITETVDRYLAAIDAGAGQSVGLTQPTDIPGAIEASSENPSSSSDEQPAPQAAISPQPVAQQQAAPETEVPSVIDSIVAEAQADFVAEEHADLVAEEQADFVAEEQADAVQPDMSAEAVPESVELAPAAEEVPGPDEATPDDAANDSA